MTDCYLMPNEQFFSYIMARTSYILFHEMVMISTLSQLTQCTGRPGAPLGQIILNPSQPVFALSPKCCLLRGEKQQIPIL